MAPSGQHRNRKPPERRPEPEQSRGAQAGAGAQALGASQQAGAQRFSQNDGSRPAWPSARPSRQRWHFGAHSQPQAAGAQAPEPGAEHKPPERRGPERHSRPGRSSSSRSRNGSRRVWPSAAPRGKDGSSSARSRKPARSTWGPHKPRAQPEPGHKPPRRKRRSRTAGRGAAALLAAAGHSGLQPFEEAGTAALRSAGLVTTAGRLTSLGCFAALGGFARTARTSKQVGRCDVRGGHDAQSEEGHRRQKETTLHGSYSL